MSPSARVRAACAAGALALLAGALSVAQEREGAAPAAQEKADPATWSSRCGDCHVEQGWSAIQAPHPERFDHALTGFPLRGAHREVECSSCHSRGLSGLTSSCSTCHHDPHAGQNSLRCDACHTARDWEVPRGFFVHERTRFPLTGAHAALACEACHRPARAEPLAATPTECLLCHRRDWASATPDHRAAGFTDCGRCHTTATFAGATYPHQSFPLTGRHAQAACVDCHTGSGSGALFGGLASGGSDCRSCHLAEYTSTATLPGVPNHPASNFSSDCRQCHLTVDPPITFQGAQ